MTNVITIAVLLVIIGGAALHMYKAKKRGEVCVGCPYAKQCASAKCSRKCSGQQLTQRCDSMQMMQ